MQIEIKEKAIKDLKKIDKSNIDKIFEVIERLANYP